RPAESHPLAGVPRFQTSFGTVFVPDRSALAGLAQWRSAHAGQRKDSRYFEIVEDTITPIFDHRYFVIQNRSDGSLAIQPFFILDQDLLAGCGRKLLRVAGWVRRFLPRFLKAKTLMVGCAAGEGHLDGPKEHHRWRARCL